MKWSWPERFEVFNAVTMKNAVFWDVASCRWLQPPAHAGSSLADFSTLKMEAIRFSETSAHTRSTRRHIPEDGILHVHGLFKQFCENLQLRNKNFSYQLGSGHQIALVSVVLRRR
jgi:hypothetical protein